MSFNFDALRAAVARHGRVGRIVIADHAGSAPRETGTAMLVWETGQGGTIGGGALEFEAVTRMRGRLAEGGTQIDRLPLGPALGQCCGGSVVLVSEVFDGQVLETIDPAAGLYVRRCGGTEAEPLPMKRARSLMRNGSASAPLTFEAGWLAEPLARAQTPLWIYGAGHVGRALVDVLVPLPELAITWVDTGPERFPHAPPEGVTCLPAANPADAVHLAPHDAHHLVLTYSHALDLELCHRLLGHGFASTGLIGSQTKWARFRSRLAALGHAPDAIARITCPIGDPGLGKHPQAIALGVGAALLTSLRARGEARTEGGRARA